MKKIILLTLFYSVTFSQSGTSLLRKYWLEIYLGVTNYSSPGPTAFHMEAIGPVWGEKYGSTLTYEITCNYHSMIGNALHTSIIDHWEGFEWVHDQNESFPIFGFSLYKLGDTENSHFIFLDYRDDNFGHYSVSDGEAQDIWIRYDWANEIFQISNKSTDQDWVTFQNGSTINIWDFKSISGPSTGKFEPYPPDNFAINVKDQGYPILVWDHSSVTDDYWTGYKIYRAITDLWDDPRYYSLLDSVGQYVTEYHDQSITFGGWDYAYYYLTAANTYIESDPTEELGADLIRVSKKGNKIISENNLNIVYQLNPAYPNPFNPSTTMTYSVPETQNVIIKVFDALGNELKVVVNQIKEAGLHSVKFNADNLAG